MPNLPPRLPMIRRFAPLVFLLLCACATPPQQPSPPASIPTPQTPPPKPPSPPAATPPNSSEKAADAQSEASKQEAAKKAKAEKQAAKEKAAKEQQAAAKAGSPPSPPAGTSAAGSGAPPPDAGGPVTDAERRAAVNRDFDKTLEAFDARIAREQIALQADREAAAAAASTVGGGGGDSGDGSTGPGGFPPGGIAGIEGDTDVPPPPGGDSSGRASRGNRPDLPIPKDIPDGRDDDVVARQLREAAERETDPALRERLWKEYRDYKKKQ